MILGLEKDHNQFEGRMTILRKRMQELLEVTGMETVGQEK